MRAGAGNIINLREVRAREMAKTDATRAVARISVFLLLTFWVVLVGFGAMMCITATSGAINSIARIL